MSKNSWLFLPSLALLALSLACGGATAPTATKAPAAAATATRAPAAAAVTATPVQAIKLAEATPTPVPQGAIVARGRAVLALKNYGDTQTNVSCFNSGYQRPLTLNVFDGLFRRTRNGEWVGSTVQSWKAFDDRWELTLKPNIKFHDGTTATATDVQTAIRRHTACTSPIYAYRGEFLDSIERVDIVDDRTLIVRTKGPYPIFMVRGEVCCGPVPTKYIEQVGEASYDAKPIGTGPYRFISRQRDQQAVIEATGTHYELAPEVKTVVLVPVAEDTTRVAMLKTGEADLIDGVLGPWVNDVKAFGKGVRVVLTDNADVEAIRFLDLIAPNEPSPLHDIRVRQAMAYALDIQGWIDKFHFGNAKLTGNFITPLTIGFDPELKPITYDAERAKQFLRDAGYSGGFEMPFVGTAATAKAGEFLQAQWAKVGIRLNVNIADPAQSATLIASKKARGLTFAASAANVLSFAEGEQAILYWWLARGNSGYVPDKTLDDMYVKLHGTVDRAERVRLTQEIVRRMREQMFGIPLTLIPGGFGVGPRVDWVPTPGFVIAQPLHRLTWRPGNP